MKTKIKKKTEWQLQEAKAMFSEVVKASLLKPQIITVHGEKTAVILSYKEFNEITVPKQSLIELFQNSPFYGVKLDLPKRKIEKMREVNL
ncbi:MAG: type II toxin-antitoxin system Phd/YefM family antitoxin [Treponema sp.]|nr:type II toxin-antitoxin system Phd/YefM family antitoxin [Treponema sp.]